MYGNTTNNSRFRTVRTNVTIDDFSEIYGSGITWATADTQGYLSVSYSSGKAFIGGGNSNKLNWSYQLLHSGNYSSIVDGRYLRWGGTNANVAAMTWGTLTSSNGYTILSHASSSDGGDMGFCNKSGQIFMQLDGYYYQNEGQYRVTDVSETVTALGTNGNYLTWTKNGSTNNITVPYATNSDTLDSKHASDFAAAFHTTVRVSSANSYTRVCSVSETLQAGVSCLVNVRAHYNSTVHNVTFLCTTTYNGKFNIIELSNAHLTAVKIRIGSTSNYGTPMYIDVTTASTYCSNSTYYVSVIPLQDGCTITKDGTQGVAACSYTTERTSTVGGAIAISGNMYAAHFYENSDARLKENIKSILGYENLPKLREFNWKSDGSKSYGLIAQELEEQGYSELVDSSGDHKTVNYSAALSLIVAKLQNKISELEEELEKLKSSK